MKKILKYGILTIVGLLVTFIIAFYGRAAIDSVSGLAVAQSGTKWNNLKDMAFGDGATNGVGYMSPCLWNGSSCDKQRGSTTSGAEVNVKAFFGSTTPADNFSNPTTAIPTFSLGGVWDGSNWDRLYGDSVNGAFVNVKQVPVSGTAFFAITKTNLTTASSNQAFGFTSKKVAITTASSNTQNVCIDWIGGTAVCPSTDTAGDDVFAPGKSIVLDDYAVTSVSAIAASGTQTVIIEAWN